MDPLPPAPRQSTAHRWACTLAAGLVLTTAPASAWTILAKVAPDGNELFGPTDLAGSGRPNQNKTVTINYSSNYPPPNNPVVPGPTFDQIVGSAQVNIRSGALTASTHAAGYDHQVLRQVAALANLSETVTSFGGSGSWAVLTTVFGGGGGTSAAGGSSTGIFQASINDTRIQSNFSSITGWSYPSYTDSNPNSFAVISANGGGFHVELHVLIPGSGQLLIEAGLRSESSARGRVSTGPALASQNMQGSLYLTLPAGVGYSSTSGVFLADAAAVPPPVPEPGTWALLLAGVAAVGWRTRRSLATH